MNWGSALSFRVRNARNLVSSVPGPFLIIEEFDVGGTLGRTIPFDSLSDDVSRAKGLEGGLDFGEPLKKAGEFFRRELVKKLAGIPLGLEFSDGK